MNTMKYRNWMAPSIAARTFFDDAFGRSMPSHPVKRSFAPLVNIRESESTFTVEMAVPGMTKSDIRLEVKDDILVISGEHKTEQNVDNEKYTRREFSYASFNRSFALPETIDSDAISATYENGILKVSIPKKQEVVKNKARQIEVA
jgi:HSP20 family protein